MSLPHRPPGRLLRLQHMEDNLFRLQIFSSTGRGKKLEEEHFHMLMSELIALAHKRIQQLAVVDKVTKVTLDIRVKERTTYDK